MGHKVNPIALRLGIFHDFKSVGFYRKRNYKENMLEDLQIRGALFARLRAAGVGEITIERSPGRMRLTIYVVRPGIVIGRGGSGMEELKKEIQKLLGNSRVDRHPRLELKVEPIKEPNLNAYLVATNIADQLIRRMPYKRIMRQASEKVMTAGAKGVRIILSGRIAGAEIGRRERVQNGKVSLSTIRENIDFSAVPALTKSGYIGVKVWINRV